MGRCDLLMYSRCESVLGEFLRGITNNPQKAHFSNMVNILILHSQSTGNDILNVYFNKNQVHNIILIAL